MAGILNVSQVLVAPFEGILRTDSFNRAGSVLDIAAIVAFVGWTIIELIVALGHRASSGASRPDPHP